MVSTEDNGDGGAARKKDPERLSLFSDAEFAVLITVFALGLRPPDLPTFKALLSLWPTWPSYAVRYLFVAIVWVNHLRGGFKGGRKFTARAWALVQSAQDVIHFIQEDAPVKVEELLEAFIR